MTLCALEQVAHFLRDVPTCTRAAAQLATLVDEAQSWTSPCSVRLLEALDALQPDLLDLVLQQSALPLNAALVTLPSSLHGSVVRANLLQAGHLDLSRQLLCAIVPSLGQQLACMSSCIRHLDVSHNHLGLRASADLSLLLAPLKVLHSPGCVSACCTLHAACIILFSITWNLISSERVLKDIPLLH